MNDIKKSAITNADKLLQNALIHHYAIAHINANNLEWIKAIIEVATETKTPIMIGFSPNAIKYMGGFKCCVDMCYDISNEININNIPIVIHLDHGSYDDCLKAIAAGFTSLMFDGSKLSFSENFAKSQSIVKLCKAKNISVELELGKIGADQKNGELANIDECKEFAKLIPDSLAVGIGNIHGIYPSNWSGLNFDHLAKIHEALPSLPLVLHGGTGIDNSQITKAIDLGICKININTECQLAFQKALRQYFNDQKDLDFAKKGYDPRKILGYGMLAVKQTIIDKLILFKCYGVN